MELGKKELLVLEALMSGKAMYGAELVEACRKDMRDASVYRAVEELIRGKWVDTWLDDKAPTVRGTARRMVRINGRGQLAVRLARGESAQRAMAAVGA